MSIIAEYIWIDGTSPTKKLRSKTKVIQHSKSKSVELDAFPTWQFDGSSTSQADGDSSDCSLVPIRIYPDPIRGARAYLVLCEVNRVGNEAHTTNSRAKLRSAINVHGWEKHYAWFGFEQEYTLYKGSRPLGFHTDRRFPAAQGPYYCGVGADDVHGRGLVEKHMMLCLEAGLMLQGVNAEVMPGQWEFQIGGPNGDALRASDDLWVARWLLYRIGEDFGISATLDPKPVSGAWNGAGMHTNFSTENMRKTGGMLEIQRVIGVMENRIREHLTAYGAGYEMRLTGLHETCRYDEFKWGVSDRTASVRIPAHVHSQGHGYLEDRRPNANADPYDVALVLLQNL